MVSWQVSVPVASGCRSVLMSAAVAFAALSADDHAGQSPAIPAAAAARAAQVSGAAELQPEAYRDAVLFTAAGTDVTAGRLPWARSGVASARKLLADTVVALPGDAFLISQPFLSKDRRYVRVDARGWVSPPPGAARWPSAKSAGGDLAVAPDGRILLLVNGTVWWIGVDGRPSRLMRGSDKEKGIAGVAVLPSREAIVADSGSSRIVRVGADGVQMVIAGNGESVRTGDGGLAVNAGIGSLGPLAAFPDGSFLLTQQETTQGGMSHVVRRVETEGRITTVAGGGASASDDGCMRGRVRATSVNFKGIDDLLALPAGDFLLSDRLAGVLHVSRSGELTQIVCGSIFPSRDSAKGDRFYTNLDGRRASQVLFSWDPKSLAVTSDGTLLIATSSRYNNEWFVAMLAPAGVSRRLAVAVAPESHATLPRRRLVIAATHPANVAIRVVQRHKTVMKTQAAVQGGRTTVLLPRGVPMGDVDVLVSARASDGRVAADRLRTIIPGRRGLPVASVRRLILRYVGRQAVVSNPRIRDCKAISPTTVRCRLLDDPEEDYSRDQQWIIRRTRDGLLHASIRDTGHSTIGDREVIQP